MCIRLSFLLLDFVVLPRGVFRAAKAVCRSTLPPPHLLLLLRHQVPQRQIIHHILHILDPVLQPVAATSQAVVFQVKNLEASMQVLDELVDEQRALVVAERDSITCKACL